MWQNMNTDKQAISFFLLCRYQYQIPLEHILKVKKEKLKYIKKNNNDKRTPDSSIT